METVITHEFEAFGAPLLKRIHDINEKKKNTNKFYGLEFLGKYRDIPVIEVRIDFPIYRLANGRTRTFQREYLAIHPEAPKNLFSDDQNSFEAQYAQHIILLKLAEEENLFKTFKEVEQIQTEPLICTSDGVVVNGNRRLCAWRELYYRDQVKYKHFQTITIAVLQECDEEAIEQLESKLQIQNTMKAEYHWHTLALMIKEKLDQGKKDGEIAKLFGKNPSSIRLSVDARDYAEQYLTRIGKPDQWSLVDKNELAFQQMAKCRKKLTSAGDKELFETLAFTFIEEGSTDGRLYEKIPEIADNLPRIAEELKSELDVSNNGNSDGDTDNNPDDIALLAGDDNVEVEDTSKIAEAVRNSDNPAGIQEFVCDVIDSEEQLKQEKKSKNSLLNLLSKAARDLENAINTTLNDDVNIVGAAEQLDAIEEKVGELREWLSEQDENNH